jgi:hypothetical protein
MGFGDTFELAYQKIVQALTVGIFIHTDVFNLGFGNSWRYYRQFLGQILSIKHFIQYRLYNVQH